MDDEDGWVLRQIELRGPDKTPTVAAALSEWPDAARDGLAAVQAYGAKYGGLADQPMSEWDEGFPHVEVERAEFERVWRQARAHLAGSQEKAGDVPMSTHERFWLGAQHRGTVTIWSCTRGGVWRPTVGTADMIHDMDIGPDAVGADSTRT